MSVTIVWFWNDLRVSDNPALYHAAKRGRVLPVFIYAEDIGVRKLGSVKKWWLYKSLVSLNETLKKYGVGLVIRTGFDAVSVLKELVREVKADAVYWNRRFDPTMMARDERVKKELISLGVKVECFDSFLLHDPNEILTSTGKPYVVFTPFWKRLRKDVNVPRPLPSPERIQGVGVRVRSEKLEDLGFLPEFKRCEGLEEFWKVNEDAARERLRRFVTSSLEGYERDRDFPYLDGTSLISPYLASGLISPRQVWYEVIGASEGKSSKGVEAFLRSLAWREFSYHLLYHNPSMLEKSVKSIFERFPWRLEKSEFYERWTAGLTGIPIIDAGMRQLRKVGWMHNRVRMIVASWFTKNLLFHWKLGEEWFWDTLVDADIANNVQNWQWVAGCGIDPVPFFRVFNPILQSRKFDPKGVYIKKWLPELEKFPSEYVHEPWKAPLSVLKRAGVELGKDYPLPMISVEESGRTALELYKRLRRA